MLPSCACIEASTANNRLAPDSVAVRTQFTIILLGKVCDSSRRDTDSSWKNWLSGPFYASFFFDRVGS